MSGNNKKYNKNYLFVAELGKSNLSECKVVGSKNETLFIKNVGPKIKECIAKITESVYENNNVTEYKNDLVEAKLCDGHNRVVVNNKNKLVKYSDVPDPGSGSGQIRTFLIRKSIRFFFAETKS